MSVENKAEQEDPVVLVYLRNEFYKQKYYLALGVYVLSIVVILLLAGVLNYLVHHPTEPLYFPADNVSRLIKDVPLTEPNMSLDDVVAWTIEAVEATYSYDYMNYRQQIQNSQKYFAAYGSYKYLKALRESLNLVALTQRKLVAIAKVVEPPKLIGQGILKTGSYGYKFEIPVLVTYLKPPYDDKSSFQNPLIVNVVVQRQKILESYKGLGVMQMNARIVTS